MTTAAQAQTASVCAPVDKMIAGLRDGTFKERPAGAGVINNMLMRLFINPTTGTFTFIVIRPDGIACIMTAGDGWQWPQEGKPGKEL
jgi:hypothetical protein